LRPRAFSQHLFLLAKIDTLRCHKIFGAISQIILEKSFRLTSKLRRSLPKLRVSGEISEIATLCVGYYCYYRIVMDRPGCAVVYIYPKRSEIVMKKRE